LKSQIKTPERNGKDLHMHRKGTKGSTKRRSTPEEAELQRYREKQVEDATYSQIRGDLYVRMFEGIDRFTPEWWTSNETELKSKAIGFTNLVRKIMNKLETENNG
jgi:hypothetical protein